MARLVRRMGLQGAVRGRHAKTTRAPVHSERPDERVNRDFQVSRPNALWVSDPRFHHSGAGPHSRFHGGRLYVATRRGFACTALRHRRLCAAPPRTRFHGHKRSRGGRVSNSLSTDLPFDALEQALHERRARREGLVACGIPSILRTVGRLPRHSNRFSRTRPGSPNVPRAPSCDRHCPAIRSHHDPGHAMIRTMIIDTLDPVCRVTRKR